MNTKDVARQLGITTSGVLSLVKSGKLTATKVDSGSRGFYEFDEALVENYRESRKGKKKPGPRHGKKPRTPGAPSTNGFISTRDAGRALGISISAVGRAVRDGRLSGSLDASGRKLHIDPASLESYTRRGHVVPRQVTVRVHKVEEMQQRSQAPEPARIGALGRIEEKIDAVMAVVAKLEQYFG